MARVLLVIMMVCACFCVNGCKKKESTPTTTDEVQKQVDDAKPKAQKATDEVEGTTELMQDMQ